MNRKAGPGRVARQRSAAAAVAGICALALVGACSASPSRTGSAASPARGGPASSSDAGGSANAPLVAFSRCVRAHGVANFPDPQAGATNAKFPSAQQLRVSSSQLSTAETACQRLLPVGVDDQFPQAEVPLLLRSMLPFSDCMRSHGVPNFPDPAVDPTSRSNFTAYKHNLGYSYANPYANTAAVASGFLFTNKINPGFVLAADLNPGVAGQNSRNHEKRGQNVLFADIHVQWETTTQCGIKNDDIYTNKAGAFQASPVDATASVLLPTDQ